MVWPVDHDEFCIFPIQSLSESDRIIWYYNYNDKYYVQSAYHLALNDGVGNTEGILWGSAKFFDKL